MNDSFNQPPQEIPKDKPEEIKKETEKKIQVIESIEEQLRREFLRHSFLIVEDDPRPIRWITDELKTKRGVEKGKEDSGIVLATNYLDFVYAVEKLLSQKTLTGLVVILDLNFPEIKGGQILELGSKASEYIRKEIKDWNSRHPDQQITLEIIMNSSMIENMEQAQAFGAVGFSDDKSGAVSVIEELFKNQLKNRNS